MMSASFIGIFTDKRTNWVSRSWHRSTIDSYRRITGIMCDVSIQAVNIHLRGCSSIFIVNITINRIEIYIIIGLV